jgi:hypothetical protein
MDITFHQQEDVISAYAGMTRNWDSSAYKPYAFAFICVHSRSFAFSFYVWKAALLNTWLCKKTCNDL